MQKGSKHTPEALKKMKETRHLLHCHFCKKAAENVVKRSMKIPEMKEIATSEKPMCDECATKIGGMMKAEWIEPVQ